MGVAEMSDEEEFPAMDHFFLRTENCVRCGRKDPMPMSISGHVHSFDHTLASTFCSRCAVPDRGRACKEYDGGCDGPWRTSMGVVVDLNR